MTRAWLVLAVALLAGCEDKKTKYTWACYTYRETSKTARDIIEYPCNVRHERKAMNEWVEVQP